MKFPFALLPLSFILFAQTCNKEIALPNPELKKIFGKWEWIETSGGFTGKIITPAKSGRTEEIEFTGTGLFLNFKNGILSGTKRFEITVGESILTSEPAYMISFSSVDSTARQSLQKKSLRFSGNDTLSLFEECHDCFSHTYVRKK